MPKHDGFELDYNNIPAMKRDALEKAKRYFSELTESNTKKFLQYPTVTSVSVNSNYTQEDIAQMEVNIKDKNALKAYFLDLYNVIRTNQLEARQFKRLIMINEELNQLNTNNTLTPSDKAKQEKVRKKLAREKETIEAYPTICESVVGVLEYLESGRPSELDTSTNDINVDKTMLALIEEDIAYLMNHSSAARYYLVLFKDQFDDKVKNEIMLCELVRRGEAYRAKKEGGKNHKKHEHMVTLVRELRKTLNAHKKINLSEVFENNHINNNENDNEDSNNDSYRQAEVANRTNINFAQQAWDVLNEGKFSHKTRDLLKFYNVKTMVTLVEEVISQNDDNDDDYNNDNDNSSINSSSNISDRGSIAKRGPGHNKAENITNVNNDNIRDDVSDISNYSQHNLEQMNNNDEQQVNAANNAAGNTSVNSLSKELVEKYNKLSALASGYRALSRLSPQVGSISSMLYRAVVSYSEEQKAEKKALKFCLDMIEGNTPEPLMRVTKDSNDFTEKQKIELYLFFECFHLNQKFQPYSNALTLLNKPGNQNHDFWKHYGHRLTLETPKERNERKRTNQSALDTLEQRMVYLRYDQDQRKLKYSVISPTTGSKVDAELSGVPLKTMAIYSGQCVRFEQPPENNAFRDVLYIYAEKEKDSNQVNLKYYYQASDTSSLKEGYCSFLTEKYKKEKEQILKKLDENEVSTQLSYEKELTLKNTIIDAARSAGSNFGLQQLGHSKAERGAAEDEIFRLLIASKNIHPHRFAEYKKVYDKRETRQTEINTNRAIYGANKA